MRTNCTGKLQREFARDRFGIENGAQRAAGGQPAIATKPDQYFPKETQPTAAQQTGNTHRSHPRPVRASRAALKKIAKTKNARIDSVRTDDNHPLFFPRARAPLRHEEQQDRSRERERENERRRRKKEERNVVAERRGTQTIPLDNTLGFLVRSSRRSASRRKRP